MIERAAISWDSKWIAASWIWVSDRYLGRDTAHPSSMEVSENKRAAWEAGYKRANRKKRTARYGANSCIRANRVREIDWQQGKD